jgi:hypothetical protein
VENAAQPSLNYALEALRLSHKTGDKSSEAWSLLYMGYAYLLLHDMEKAEEAFRSSIALRDELGQPGMRIESLAGLIQTMLLKADYPGALEETEKIISHLHTGATLEGVEEPLRVYYTFYLALKKTQDPRADAMLQSAAQFLESQVLRLRDENSRKMYVENIPWRLAIQQAWREASVRFKDSAPSGDRQR